MQIIKKDPRTRLRKQAEIIVSQMIEVNIYKILANNGCLLLHAAALEKDGKGTLIFGPQNVGKTTISLGLSNRGWKMLGDDFCIIDHDKNLTVCLNK